MPHADRSIRAWVATASTPDGPTVLAVAYGDGRRTVTRSRISGARAEHAQLAAAVLALEVPHCLRTGRAVHVQVILPPDSAEIAAGHLDGVEHNDPNAGPVLAGLATLAGKVSATGGSVSITPGEPPAQVLSRLTRELKRARRRLPEDWQLPSEVAGWAAAAGATIVYTDGAYLHPDGFGAWAWWVDETRHGAGTVAGLTSDMVERLALVNALRSIDGPLLVVADYDAITRVKCPDRVGAGIVAELAELCDGRPVRLHTVKSHRGCPGNAAADRLARSTCLQAWAATGPEARQACLALTAELAAERAAARAAAHAQWLRNHPDVAARGR